MSRPGYVDKRGNARDRERRRAWVLATFDPELDGRAHCRLRLATDCLGVVDGDTLSVDRIEPGGTYARHNIQPACLPCQSLQGGLIGQAWFDGLRADYRAAHDAWTQLFETVTHTTYEPGVIKRERERERRGGRREVVDFVEAHPPPRWRDWLIEASQAAQDAAGAPSDRFAV